MDTVDTHTLIWSSRNWSRRRSLIYLLKKDGDCTLLVRHTVRTVIDVFNFLLDYACRALWLIHWYTDDLDASTYLYNAVCSVLRILWHESGSSNIIRKCPLVVCVVLFAANFEPRNCSSITSPVLTDSAWRCLQLAAATHDTLQGSHSRYCTYLSTLALDPAALPLRPDHNSNHNSNHKVHFHTPNQIAYRTHPRASPCASQCLDTT